MYCSHGHLHASTKCCSHTFHTLLLRTNSHPKLPHARPRTRRAFQNHDALSSIPDIKCAVTFGDQSSDSWLAQEYSQKHEHPAIVATGDGEFTAFSDVDTHCRAFNDATSTGATPSTDDAMNTEYDDLLDSDTTDGECVGVLMHHEPSVLLPRGTCLLQVLVRKEKLAGFVCCTTRSALPPSNTPPLLHAARPLSLHPPPPPPSPARVSCVLFQAPRAR